MPAESIEPRYVLHDLPSAQHKAGLAGLIVMLRSLQARRKRPLPEVLHLSPGELRIRVSEASLQVLFDDLYDATTGEVQRATKRPGQTPRRELSVEQRDPETGKTQQVRQYVYEQVVPKAEFLRALGMPAVWLKLWREAVWSTLRGIPKTRLPYEQRRHGQPTTLAAATWADLVRWRSSVQNGRAYSTGLASALFVGAQARTAEGVPFQGDASQNFLLHFWPAVMTCWVPEVLRVERARRQLHLKREQVGFVLAIPEVADLQEFVETLPRVVGELSKEMAGFRPRQALISIPEEGALEFLREVARITRARAGREETSWSVHTVEVHHLEKRGNIIPVLHTSRVPMDRGTLERYELVREVRHPLLKGQLIRNVLRDEPWHYGFEAQFAANPSEVFFHRDFVSEVSRRFDRARQRGPEEVANRMTIQSIVSRTDLAPRVHDMIRAYVLRRTASRSQITWEEFRSAGDQRRKEAYRQAREKVCTDAFLAMRSRRSREEFRDYFVGTICAVPQYLPDQEYREIATALATDSWEEVRSLAMLALSAHSKV